MSSDSGRQSRFRVEADSPLEIYRQRPARRFIVTTSGGYFPILAVLPTGRVVACVRTDDFHVGQRGRLSAVLSDDGGESWSYAIPIDPQGPDDRNAAVGVLPDGSLLCAFYRADCYENGSYQGDRGRPFGVVLSRSADGGETWSAAEPIPSLAARHFSAFGRIAVLPNGDLLLPVYGSGDRAGDGGNGLGQSEWVRSQDGGYTWSDPLVIAPRYNETSILPLPDGRLLAATRSDDKGDIGTCVSSDGGITWTAPQTLTAPREHPPDLLLLADGRVLLTYGRRIAPFGVRAMVSHDLGTSWATDQKIVLAADPTSTDCGYPSSVQLTDGSILTAYYAVESRGFWPERYGWHHGDTTLGPHCAVVKYSPEDLP